MAVNLIRNARVFFSSHVDAITGILKKSGGMTASNTFEIQVLDGLTFSQDTNTETVTINESGTSPNRGQQGFNTALNPVSFSFSTYMKPAKSGSINTAEEAPLWNALTSDGALSDANGWSDATAGGNPATVNFTASDKNQLQKFALIIAMDDSTFVIENCVLGEATIDFGLDGIATIAWSGQGASISRYSGQLTVTSANSTTQSLALAGFLTEVDGTNITLKRITENCYYLANRLSVLSLTYNTVTYTVAITGGSITISNNITYLTPATVGIVNKPFTYFTGTRAISGSFSAYLRDGTGQTGSLYNALMTASATEDQPTGNFTLSIGGSASTVIRVDMAAAKAMFTVPGITTDQVVGTTINFTALGSDLDTANELTFNYYAGTTA